MISLALATALSLAATQGDPTIQSRKAFVACLSNFKKTSEKDKLDAEAFSAAIKTACQAEATAFRDALVNLDVKRGSKRAEALTNANFDIDGYRDNMDENYRDAFAPTPPK